MDDSRGEVVVVAPLLESKLHVPSRRPGAVPRVRLNERLSAASRTALTLLSAPAGFGKTTLLTEWLATLPADGPSVAWLSLDRRDNDPTLFWTYVVASLQRAAGIGDSALSLLQSPQPSIEAALAVLLNDLHASGDDILLVLDDYHLIEAPEVRDGMAFLLEHPPPQLHVVLGTRADPALALGGLRGRGQLLEVRAADLRFTPEESTAYLNGAMGLALTSGDVAALDGRTEGWIAALQLAALSMQGRDDASAFIAGFAGDDRYLVDYLVEEVLARQPADTRDFLLRTAVLGRLTGPLCDAVTGREGGTAALLALERANLFLIPLDDRRQWYRYHHLFADVLKAHLQEEYGPEVRELRRRASVWFEQHGEPAEAIDYALAGADFSRAADLMELAIPVMARSRQESTLRSWVPMLPDEMVRVRPVLGVAFAGALAQVSEFDTVGSRLADIERILRPTAVSGPWPEQPPPGVVVVDIEGFRRLPGNVEMYRAALALRDGDLDGTVSHAWRAMSLSPPDDHLTRAGAAALAGLASWTTGDLASAHAGYAEAVAGLRRAGHISDVLGCSITLADIRRTQGRLDEAVSAYEEALELAAVEPGAPPLRGTADMQVGMAGVLLERDDFPAAAQRLATSQQLGEHNGLPQNLYRWRVAMAQLRAAEGDLDTALELLDEADRVYSGDYSPNVRPVPAERARLRVRRGELGHALAWARERQLSPDDDLSYLREFEHITLARLLIAGSTAGRAAASLDEATGLLERLLVAAEHGERGGSVIEILVLQALAHQSRGDVAAALAPLHRAVGLAEPEGYVRVFADEGPPMAALLKPLSRQASASRYVRRLLAATSTTERHPPVKASLVEPLSGRELDVLRLLGTDMDGPDIARELSVSLNTMRTHTKNIYAKLGVTNRRAAVRQAGELNLLSRIRDH
ncbi:MAG: LuxR C-terminal-related transcriptional regulator [Sporichthyaceae bacterium]